MKAMLQRLKPWTCVLAAVLVAGCAFGTRQATLIYPPASAPGEKAPSQLAAKPEAKQTKVFLTAFRDVRSDRSVVGTVRNGFGMRTADVVTTNSVTDWVTQAVQTELRNNGYSVAYGAPSDSTDSGSVMLSGEVLNVFCDMYMSYTGQVSLVAKVSNGGGELFNQHYAGEGSAGIAWGATGESYAQSLALALASAIKKLVSDLDAKLSVH